MNLAGTLFFQDLEAYRTAYQIFQGARSDPSQATVVLTVPRRQNVRAWVGTSADLFWTDGHSIRRHYNVVQ